MDENIVLQQKRNFSPLTDFTQKSEIQIVIEGDERQQLRILSVLDPESGLTEVEFRETEHSGSPYRRGE
jgi:hypothetical protein